MTVSSGFFNSVNHDRLYDATQLSSIFDGIIKDGVYQGIGKALRVSAKTDSNNTVIIGSGRAWFDHTWTLNDSDYALVLDSPNEFLGRIDAIVLDVNREENTRKNEIKYLIGSFSSSPQKPALVKSTLHNQYPLAYITIHPGSDAPISDADIEICVGTEACPLVTGLLEVINSDVFMQQVKGEFNDWFNGIKDLIDENTALKLQNQIDELNNKIDNNPILGVPQEAYDFAVNWEIIGPTNNNNQLPFPAYDLSKKFFLPDGYAIDVGPFNVSTVSATDSGRNICIHIIDKNFNIVSSTLLQTLASNSVIKRVWGICINADSYPATFKFFVNGSQADSSNDLLVSHCLYVIDVTVSSNHVVSKTVTSKTVSKNTSLPDTYHDAGFTNPVKLNDGSYVIHICYSYTTGSQTGLYGCFFTLSSSNVISYKEPDRFYINKALTSFKSSLFLTSSEQYYILKIGSSYGTVYQASDFTNLGSDQLFSWPDPKEVKKPLGFVGYYYDKNNDKKYLQSNSDTPNVDNGEPIPLIFNFNYETGSPSSSSLTPDGKFLINSYDYESSYTEYKYYHSFIDFSKGFSMEHNYVDSEADDYIGYFEFSPSEKSWFYDEELDQYMYLSSTGYSINMNIDPKYDQFAYGISDTDGYGIYIIRRKES